MKIRNLKNNEEKEVYSVKVIGENTHVCYQEGGKEYRFKNENVEIINNEELSDESFYVYEYKRNCYNCKKDTDILTYIKFNDGTKDDVVFPYDKERLLENQDLEQHLSDPACEYYGLIVLGDDARIDGIMAKLYPEKIKLLYSTVINRKYYMNVCEHCGCKQGKNYVLKGINDFIRDEVELKIVNKEKNKEVN
ncbi:MAG: hypothetical protein RR557_08605 [Bacilli bacterium]